MTEARETALVHITGGAVVRGIVEARHPDGDVTVSFGGGILIRDTPLDAEDIKVLEEETEAGRL